MALQKNLSKKIRGDTYPIIIDSIKLNDVAIDLQGYTFFFTLKQNRESQNATDTDAILQKTWTVASGVPVYSTSFVVSASDMDIQEADYFYDIQYKTPAGVIKTVLIGTFPIINDITRRIS